MRVALHNASTITKYCMSNKSLITLLVIANTSSNNTREDSTHGHHQMANTEIRLIIFFAVKDGESSIQSAKTRPGAACGSDHELLIAKFRLKLKKEKPLDHSGMT